MRKEALKVNELAKVHPCTFGVKPGTFGIEDWLLSLGFKLLLQDEFYPSNILMLKDGKNGSVGKVIGEQA